MKGLPLGITDRQCRLCFALALWNERDPILKERLFGLTGPQGNHGEDVKECYYYLGSTPTHAYMKALYKYPQAEYPYEALIRENRNRGREEPEFELQDTGIFDAGRYFDIFIEYAKASPNDILIRITVANRGPDPATLHLLPTVWFRNTWSWGGRREGCEPKPRLQRMDDCHIEASHHTLGTFSLSADAATFGSRPAMLFTENESHLARLAGSTNKSPFVKDAIHRCVIGGEKGAVNPDAFGTKASVHQVVVLRGGESATRAAVIERRGNPGRTVRNGF